MNILVTGALGQLGKSLYYKVDEWKDSLEDDFIFTDINEFENQGKANVEKLDITDEDSVLKFVQERSINVIVNCAAYTNVDKAESDQDAAYLLNEIGPMNLAKAAATNGAVLIHISTDYVYNGMTFMPYREDHGTYPVNVYGKSKLAGEQRIIESNCHYIILRTQWLYSSIYGHNNFFNTVFDKIDNGMTEMRIVSDQIGSPTSANSLAEAIIHIINGNKLNQYLSKTGIYNFRDEGVCSWYDFAQEILSCFDLKNIFHTTIIPISTKDWEDKCKAENKITAKRPYYAILDISKFKETFNYIPHDHRTNVKAEYTIKHAYLTTPSC